MHELAFYVNCKQIYIFYNSIKIMEVKFLVLNINQYLFIYLIIFLFILLIFSNLSFKKQYHLNLKSEQ